MSDNVTYERILDAASGLFLHYGYKRATVDEIAAAAGISKGSVYLHFKSKEAVFGAASRRVCERVLAAMAAEAGAGGLATDRLTKVLTVAVLEIWDFCHQAPHAPALWTEVMAAAARYALEARDEGVKIIARVIADGQAEGAYSKQWSADEVARMIQMAASSYEAPYLYVESRRQIEMELPRLIQLIVGGLRSPAEQDERGVQ